jgi:hypothetical protein
MKTLPEILTLDTSQEARRLWRGARDAFQDAPDSLVALCESLDLGIRAAELFAVLRLQEMKQGFPEALRMHLQSQDPRVHWYRDAMDGVPCVQFRVLLDLMSNPELDCIAMELHGGSRPSAFPCERARASARTALGFSLSGEDRDLLLLLLAYRNRIFRCIPPVEIRKEEVLVAFPALAQLVGKMNTMQAELG